MCCSINQGKTQTTVQEDLEWVARIIQKNYTGLVYDSKTSNIIKAICKTDFDENKFLLYLYRYNKEMDLIDETHISFKEINSIKAILNPDNNETLIYFGCNWKDDGTSIFNKNIKESKYVSAWIVSISNDGEDFMWKKMNTKLNNIFNAAKGIK